ncbi:MAG: hypothetical protein ACFCUN_11960 [Hyphomicrobiaceae bacterium]
MSDMDPDAHVGAASAGQLWLVDSAHWRWSLFPNQCNLGRVQFTLRRPLEASLAVATPGEWADLQAQLARFEELMSTRFGADWFNYKQLGNQVRQLHVHGIPRYQQPVQWGGIVFEDRRYGHDPAPEPDSPLDPAATATLAAHLRSALQA